MNSREAYIHIKPGLVTDAGEVTDTSTEEFLRNYMHELARFGLHPPKALSATRRPQRFLVSLQDAAAAIREGEPLCIEVGFASALGAARGGAAQIAVQVVEAPGSNP